MQKTFIIAEAGLNHGGFLSKAFDLAKAAQDAGADAVKFQTFKTEKVLRKSDPDYDLIDKINMSYQDTTILKKYCDEIGIEFMSTPGDVESLEFLVELGVKRIKIGSDDLTNWPLIEAASDSCLPVLISTGMANFAEIGEVALEHGLWTDLTWMHCVSLYPAPLERLNLKAIRALSHKAGYSDHSIDITPCIMAVAVGASVIEKHLKLDDDCIDRVVSANPQRFMQMVTTIRSIEIMLGDGVKAPCEEEMAVRDKLRKDPHDWLRGIHAP